MGTFKLDIISGNIHYISSVASGLPSAHNTSHQNGGGDEISVAGLSGVLADDQHVIDAEVTAAAATVKIDDFAAADDNTDLNVSTSAHGLCPKLSNVSTEFLNGVGAFATPAGGSSKEYASFYLSTGGLTGVTSTEVTLVVNATSLNSDTDIFELASNQVTVNKSADFEISAQCYFNNSSTSRTEYTMHLEVDGVEVPGTRAATYQRGYDSGDTASLSIMLSVTSGEVFQLRIVRTDGGSTAGYQDDNGTRLSFKEL